MTKARDIASAAPAPSTVSTTELGYLDGVTSAIQTQINTKQATVSGVDDTEIGYLNGVTSAIQTQLDAKTAKSTLTTTGDIYYASAANTPARLGIGSTGNVLTVASGIPSWAAPAGGGKVLQVVYGSSATDTSNATSTYADTTLSASITPSSATSKVLVLVNQNGVGKTTNNTTIELKLLRGATDLINMDLISANTNDNSINFIGSISSSYLDEPATTSSTTYKTQFRSSANLSQVSVQGAGSRSTMVLLEIGA